jgi:hypothetical protein
MAVLVVAVVAVLVVTLAAVLVAVLVATLVAQTNDGAHDTNHYERWGCSRCPRAMVARQSQTALG